MTSVSSHKNQAVFQPRRNSLPGISEYFHASKREKHDEGMHLDHVKKPKKTGKRYRTKEQRPLNSSTSMPSTTGASQLQPYQGFLTHRPSMNGFDSFSSASLFPFASTSHNSMFISIDDQDDTQSEIIGGMAFIRHAATRHSHPLSILNTRTRPHAAVAAAQNEMKHHLIPGFRRYSLPPVQQHPTLHPPPRIAYSTSRPPSPPLELPPIPEMPLQDVDIPTRQQILDETVAINKELLERFGRETQQDVREILFNNVVERNKFIHNLTDDIKNRLHPRKSIWPETQYPFCIIITEDEDEDDSDSA